MVKRVSWTWVEDELVRKLYPELGAAKMRSRGILADRTREAINRRAFCLGVSNCANSLRRDNADEPWPMPQHEYSAADRAFLAWGGPVTRAPLRASA